MNLILIDVDNEDSRLIQVWGKTGFLEKLNALGGILAFWDSKRRKEFDKYLLFSDFLILKEYLSGKDISSVFYILGSQIFLDPEVLKNGLMKIETQRPDYFTQWEHSKLPVGIGIRACTSKLLRAINAPTPEEAFFKFATRAVDYGYRTLYESDYYLPYGQSLGDAQFSYKEFQGISEEKVSYDLQGFLALHEKRKMKSFKAKKAYSLIDERGLPSEYGYEDSECAKFPTYIMFDIINRCNAKCIHCPQSTLYGDNKHQTTLLELGTFKKAVDECKGKKIVFNRITADGEPFMHPDLLEMIDYAVKAKIGPVGLTTNCSLITPWRTEQLVKSGLFMVDVSLDAFKEETYNIVRNGLKYSRIMKNVESLLKARKKFKSHLKVMVSFVEQDENKNELQEFIAYWKPKVDQVLIRKAITMVNQVHVSSEHGGPDRWPCPHWWRRIIVNCDTLLKACPVDWTNGTAYKPLEETSIFDAWHSRFYFKHRMEHLNNEFSENVCKDCPDWQGTPWELGYEKVIKDFKEKKSA